MSRKPLNLLFLCMGSTCRSPMMAALYARAAASAGRFDTVFTAGWAARDGDSPSPGAVAAMTARGIDITDHRSKALTEEMVTAADFIVTADFLAAGQVQRRFPGFRHKIMMISLFGDTHDPLEIIDPAGKPQEDYNRTASLINKYVRKMVQSFNQSGAPHVLPIAAPCEPLPDPGEELEPEYQKTVLLGNEYLSWVEQHPEAQERLEDAGSSLGAYLLNMKHGRVKPGMSFNLGQLADAAVVGFMAGYWFAKEKEGKP